MEDTNDSKQPSGEAKRIFIVVMGVSGTGKSTLGSALAEALDLPYVEGDELHPRANVEKMSSGIPLTDTDREPWLELIRTTAEHLTVEKQTQENGRSYVGVVVGCSALKRYYRDILRGLRKPASEETQKLQPYLKSTPPHVLPAFFVFIDGSMEVLKDRMEKRPGHFMKVSMLDSQLRTLENPIGEDGVVVIGVEDKTEDQVRKAIDGLETLTGLALGKD